METIAYLEKQKKERRDFADKNGSPIYDIYPAAITAGVLEWFDLEILFPTSQNYLPLDFIHIVNNDIVDLQLQLPSGQKHYIPRGTIFALEDEYYQSFGLKNMDASASSTQYKVHASCQRLPLTEDRLIRRKL